MDIVLDHIQVVLNFKSFKTSLTQMPLGYFPREDLAPDKILSQKHEFHLVKNKFYFILGFQRPISFNLNLLDNFGALLGLPVGLQVLAKGLGGGRVLLF